MIFPRKNMEVNIFPAVQTNLHFRQTPKVVNLESKRFSKSITPSN